MGSKTQENSKLSGSRRSTHTPAKSSGSTGQTFLTLETSPKSTGPQSNLSMFCAEEARAKTCLTPEKAKASSKEPAAGSGLNTLKLLGYFDQNTSSLKMSTPSHGEDSISSLLILPPAGILVSGKVFGLATLAHRTAGNGCLLLPTVTASDATLGAMARKYELSRTGHWVRIGRKNGGCTPPLPNRLVLRESGQGLPNASDPSPNLTDSKGAPESRTSSAERVYLSPSFAEAIQGFPEKYTSLGSDALATAFARKSPKSSGKRSSRLRVSKR